MGFFVVVEVGAGASESSDDESDELSPVGCPARWREGLDGFAVIRLGGILAV